MGSLRDHWQVFGLLRTPFSLNFLFFFTSDVQREQVLKESEKNLSAFLGTIS